MEVLECIRTRRSVRKFKLKEIPEDDITKILDAARWAPSSGNLQNWEFIVVKNQEIKNSIAKICLEQKFIATAPVVIVVCSDQKKVSSYGKRGEEMFAFQNTAAAIQNLMLAAHSLGLGTCWIGAFDTEKLSSLLNLPKHVIPVAVVPVGYPDGEPRVPPRYELEEITHIDKYQ